MICVLLLMASLALVLVGATIVGSMATVWHGVVNPPREGVLREWRGVKVPSHVAEVLAFVNTL